MGFVSFIRLSGSAISRARSLEPCHLRARRRHAIGVSNQVRNRRPVHGAKVQSHGYPPSSAQIWRYEVATWIILHESTLLTRTSLAPQGNPSVSVMVEAVIPEDLLADQERPVFASTPKWGRGGIGKRLAQSHETVQSCCAVSGPLEAAGLHVASSV